MSNQTRQNLIQQIANLAEESKLKGETELSSILYCVAGAASVDKHLTIMSKICNELSTKLVEQLKKERDNHIENFLNK